jgi:RHS repeat-associated protein
MSAIANLLTGQGVDEYFTRTDTLGMRTLLADASGSTLALTDPGGNLLAQYTYEPFGNTTVTGSAFSPYQYTARENDGTGLYYYRARFYSPSLQRFISEDPIGFRGGTNLFAYVANTPLNFTDPYGLLQVCCRLARIPIARQRGACHCFLLLSDGQTLGGYYGFPMRLVPRKNQKADLWRVVRKDG